MRLQDTAPHKGNIAQALITSRNEKEGLRKLGPFFMPKPLRSQGCRAQMKLEKTSKQKWYFVLHFITFACLSGKASEASPPPHASEERQASISPLILACLSMGYVA